MAEEMLVVHLDDGEFTVRPKPDGTVSVTLCRGAFGIPVFNFTITRVQSRKLGQALGKAATICYRLSPNGAAK